MAVTLKDVAREAGVSAHSVSAVLNGKAEHYRISPATQERIEKLATELGYDLNNNRSARLMAAQKHGIKMLNNVIAVCSNPSPTTLHQSPFVSVILDGIENAADAIGLDVLMCRLRHGKVPGMMGRGEIDGVIMVTSTPESINSMQGHGFPIVKVGSALPGVHSVSASHLQGTSLTTSHLIDLGHQDIAYIGYGINRSLKESVLVDAARERLKGFCSAMETANLPVKYTEVTLEESHIEDGAESFNMLWKQSKGSITAVVCYNDTLAMGVIQAAHQLGLEVPKDLSVVGFDNSSKNYAFEPIISSVGYDRELMGKRAVEILMQVREWESCITDATHPKGKFIREELPVHFVEGTTTAPPRNAI